MKKFLLGTTALVGVVGLSMVGGFHTAQAAELKISGGIKTSLILGFAETDEVATSGTTLLYNNRGLDGSAQSEDVARPTAVGDIIGWRLDDADLVFEATEETDGGLSITGRFDTAAAGGNVQLDEASLKIGSSFIGYVTMGFDDGIEYGPLAHGVMPGFGGWDGSHLNALSAKTRNYVNRLTGLSDLGGDAAMLKYETPSFAGFKFGVAYKHSTVYGGDPSGNTSNATNVRNGNAEDIRILAAEQAGPGATVNNGSLADNATSNTAAKYVDTRGKANIISAGLDYSNTFGDWDLNAGVSGVFSMNGQRGPGRGSNFGIRAGVKTTYASTYTAGLGFTFGNDKPFADTDLNRSDYLGISLAFAYNYGAGSVGLGAGFQLTNRYRSLGLVRDGDGYNLPAATDGTVAAATADQINNPYTGQAADFGMVISLGADHTLAPGLKAIADVSFILGSPSGDTTPNYVASAENPGGTPAAGFTAPTDYPGANGLAVGLGMKMTF